MSSSRKGDKRKSGMPGSGMKGSFHSESHCTRFESVISDEAPVVRGLEVCLDLPVVVMKLVTDTAGG
jgi:hypothetical protein